MSESGWFWAVGGVLSDNSILSGRCSGWLFNSTWTVSDGQSSWGSNGVSHTVLSESGWFRTVGSVFCDDSEVGGVSG